MRRAPPPSAPAAAISERGPVWAAYAFLLSLLVPFYMPVGPVLLMPHRVLLLVLFVPFFLRLFVYRTAGPVLLSDWLLFVSALWAGVALMANHPVGAAIEPFGVHMIEFFGAYLLARVSIRSAEDFRGMVRVFFFIILFLLPFAILESVTRRPVLLDLLPGTSVRPVDAGTRMGLRRAQTVFAHPILFGAFVSTGLGLFWYAMRPRLLGYLGAPLTAVVTICSLSTGALISFIMQVVFIGWETVTGFLRARWRLFLGLTVLAYVTIDLLSNRTPFHVLVTYASFNTGSAYNRILIWQYGTDNVAANPLFGLGLNDWARPSWMVSSVDNFWLLLAMQYGLPAITMILVALVLLIRRVSRAELSDEGDKLCRAGYLVAFGGLAVAGGTVHYWHAMMAFALFIFGSGAWAATGGGVSADDTVREAEPTAVPRSRYTRQAGPGQPIRAGLSRADVRSAPPRRRAGQAGRP